MRAETNNHFDLNIKNRNFFSIAATETNILLQSKFIGKQNNWKRKSDIKENPNLYQKIGQN